MDWVFTALQVVSAGILIAGMALSAWAGITGAGRGVENGSPSGPRRG